MKKPLIIIIILLSIYSCKSYIDSSDHRLKISAVNAGNPYLAVSLNGIDSATAGTMITSFCALKHNDHKPIRESVWIDSVDFHNMVNLLIKERGPEHSGSDSPGQTDGMRIYFASNQDKNARHLTKSIILVSTKNCGVDTSVVSNAFHRDYYYHTRQDVLSYGIDSVKQNIVRRPFLNIFQGENLYNLTFKKNKETLDGNPHYISRNKAHAMVNLFGKDTITTKSEWFSIALLKSLDQEQHDGIRIYFTRHPAMYNGVKDVDSLKEAFVLVPTVQAKSSKRYHKDNFGTTTAIKYFNEMAMRQMAFITFHPLIDSLGGYDNGEICPTHCN